MNMILYQTDEDPENCQITICSKVNNYKIICKMAMMLFHRFVYYSFFKIEKAGIKIIIRFLAVRIPFHSGRKAFDPAP
jgi:hypothetical protein